MEEITERLHEKRQIEKAKSILESAGYKVEKSIKEATELRSFTKVDWYGWGGVSRFGDGSEPLIADGEFATLIIGGDDETEGGAILSISYGDGENPHEAHKVYDSKEDAVEDSEYFLRLIDKEINVSQIKRLGFDIIM